ncbi:hypothetical protein F2P79_019921 [Pimephales promelas]|nr:hypothetical protein F2P79_019921 [Pimephales promelas]
MERSPWGSYSSCDDVWSNSRLRMRDFRGVGQGALLVAVRLVPSLSDGSKRSLYLESGGAQSFLALRRVKPGMR